MPRAIVLLVLLLLAPCVLGAQESATLDSVVEDAVVKAVVVKNGIEITQAWIRLMPPVSKNSAGYFIIENTSQRPLHLVDVNTSISRLAEFHETVTRDSIKSMQPVSRITIEAGEIVEFNPGGKHIMLFDLNNPLQEGQQAVIQLVFENHADVSFNAEVKR